MPSHEEIIDNLRKELHDRSFLSFGRLQQLRKWLDEMNNAQQQTTTTRQGDMSNFKDKLIEVLLESLNSHPINLEASEEIQKSKMAILEILEREFISTKHNTSLFLKLFEILQRDNENVAMQASKALDTLIKKISESNGSLDRNLYLKIFELLKQKTEFLLKLSEHVKDVDYARYRRGPDERTDRQTQPPLPNYKSLKFLNQLPNLFVHLMAYVDVWRDGGDETRVKELLRESISNIIQALRRTPYQQFYEQMTQDFNSELFGVMTKLLQFLFILLKNDKESGERKENPNKYLKHHMQEQVEYIKMHEVLMNYIHLLKNCPDDFQISRYEIVNRLKLLMNNLSENRLKKEEAADVIREILNEQTIFGRNKFLGQYSKNAICNFWIDILRSPILLHHMFPPYLCSLKAIPPTPPDEFMNEFQSYFAQVERLFESTFKTIFDNSLYLSVQERSLQLMNTLIEKMFSRPSQTETINYLNSCSATARRCHEIKLALMTRVLNVVAQRFGVVKNVFKEISTFVKAHGAQPSGKRDSFGEQKMEHIQLHTLPVRTADEAKWEVDRADFIEHASGQIDSSLLTLPAVQNKFLMIYEEEEELSFNSHPIKLTNYYNYMKDAKVKVVDKCITVANKVVEIFINQNTQQHSPSESTLIKAVYYYTPTKRMLSEEQCSIMSNLLQNGLKVFEVLHDYNFHQEDPHKKGHLKSFMTIFAQIYDPINFRDIFEPNMELFFRQLLKYAKHCSEFCLQWVLIEPFCSISNIVQFNKNIVELLIYNLVIKLECSSDQLDPFHEYYEYRDDYFSLLQKLIRFPFRCLSRYNDDSFIRNYFRQIVLFLVKKAHISKFSLDYLHLMRTLFKNILYNSNKENTSPLFNEFFAICSKSTVPQQPVLYSSFVNVNVLENLHKLFETGIPELADIVTELIIMLPLKSKHIIQYAKQGFIVKPLLHCLCMMADYNYTLRTIKTFEIIVSHSSSQEISQFMDGIKDRLINRLLQIVSDSKPSELKPDKMSQDLSSLSLKLLAKLGAVPRLYQQPIAVQPRLSYDRDEQQFQLVYSELREHRKLKTSMFSAIDYSIEIFNKLLDQYYQCHILVSVEVVETAFNLLRECLPLMLEQLHPMSEKLIAVFSSLLSLHSKYITISPNLLSRIRDGVRHDTTKLSDGVTAELRRCGLNDYSKLFIRCLVVSLSERVLITREDYCIAEIAQEPKGFLWGLLQKMLRQVEETNSRKDQQEIYTYVIGLLLSQCVMINNNTSVGQSESRSNYVLPHKHAALSVLLDMLDMAPEKVLCEQALQIIEGIFVSTATIPDILNLKVLQYPGQIAQKLFGMLLRNRVFMSPQLENSMEIFTRILDNLLGSSSEAHRIAMSLLNMMSQHDYFNICELLYGGRPWSEVEDTTSEYTLSQAKFSLTALREQRNTPITDMIKQIERILNKVDEKCLANENNIRLMTNAFKTIEWLISIKFRGKSYQAFSVIARKVETGRKSDFKEDEDDEGDFAEKNFIFNAEFGKLINIASNIIGFNQSLFGANIKIILDTGAPQPPASNAPVPSAAQPPRPTAPNVPQMRNRENPPVAPSPQQNQSINPNTYFDDEEYRLNIEDIDMEIRIWGQLIASIVNFLKTTLLNENIFQIVKTNSKKKNEKSPILEQRSNIIFTLFNLVARVDRTVRATAYHALKELLSREEHPKELLSNDDKLKNILRPILICLQHDFKKFMPSFLYVFRKILKLLTQCFNNALIIKLLNHLSEIEKAKEAELTTGATRTMNYAELTHEAKCISSLLGLFQYLSFAYQSTSPKHTINSIEKIMQHTTVISRYFAPKLGRQTIKILFKENLAKLVNTMSPWFSVENLFGDAKKGFLQMIAEIIRMPQSYAIREKITRDINFADRILDEKHQYEDYITILEILKTLSKHNTHWLRKNTGFMRKLQVRFDRAVTERIKGEERPQEFSNKSEVRLLCKILLVYMRENPDDTSLMFDLARALRIRSTIDFNFLRMFYKYEVYKLYSIEAKRRIFLQFVDMMKRGEEHIETKVVCSFYIIYPLLMKSNQLGQTKEIFTKASEDAEDPIKSFIDLMKHSLQMRQLQSRQGGSTDRSSNNYRVAIEVLQLSSFVISPLKNELAEYKRDLLSIIWGLLKVEDKMLKNYAFICTSNFIRIFNIEQTNKVLSIYLTLLRGLEALTQYDYEVGALNKKALNILIPYWSEHQSEEPSINPTSDETNMTWITWTLRMLHEDTNEPFRLVRFWEIVVKNHEIFQQFKCGKFETQMINSMQWLMVTSNPSSQNPLVKKIASDLSFIYIQWKYRDIKQRLEEQLVKARTDPTVTREELYAMRKHLIDESMNEKAAEICLNFFIKVAFFNSTDKEDKQIMKRSLYLLKKMLILWPNTKKKFEQIKVVVQKLKVITNTQPAQDPPIRFHYTLLNIINIMMEFESDAELVGQLDSIFKLFDLGQFPTTATQRTTGAIQPPNNAGFTIYTINNPYLLYLVCCIVRRLIKVAYAYREREESVQFLREIQAYVREGLDAYVLSSNRNRAPNQPPQRQASTRSTLKIELVISLIKILFEFDPVSIEPCLNNLKQVASIFKKFFEQRTNTNRAPETLTVPEGIFREMLAKESVISVELFAPDGLIAADENFERENLNTYSFKRLFLVIVMRILAAKFNAFHVQDRAQILDQMIMTHEKLPDPDLKMEIINLWRCMFIGPDAFPGRCLPQRYERIGIINFAEFPLRKVFFYLFEDNSKFFEHFERRKIKPSDPTYHVNEKIHEELLTRSYFDFLCHFIRTYDFSPSDYLEKIKVFVLYACKVCEPAQLKPVFDLIERSYGDTTETLYMLLFEDFKELNCAEEYLQGDEVMLFFTRFLMQIATRHCDITFETFGVDRPSAELLNNYYLLLKSDQSSEHYNRMISEAFALSVALLPECPRLPKIITQYLLKANFSHTWGMALLKIAVQAKCLSPEQLYIICTKICEWGLLQRQLEASPLESAKWVLDELHRLNGDKDTICGFRMTLTANERLKSAYVQLQQREHYKALRCINDYLSDMPEQRKRPHPDSNFLEELQRQHNFSSSLEKTFASDIVKECYKNLNQWDKLAELNSSCHDMESSIDVLFSCREDRDRIKGIVGDLESLDYKWLPYYYGRSLLNFMDTGSYTERNKESSKDINVSMTYALLEWLGLPRNAKHKQNEILVRTQCLLQLEEGYKIKEESIPVGSLEPRDAIYEALTRVVQSIFNEINTWRERLPHKFENMTIWRTILEQRNTIFVHLKKRMNELLGTLLQQHNLADSAQNQLVPYTDIEWNKLRLIKQQRIFGIFTIEQYKTPDKALYYDELFLKFKERYYYEADSRHDHEKAAAILAEAMLTTEDPLYKTEYQRLKAKLLVENEQFKEASNVYADAAKASDEQLGILWRDWLSLCYKAYMSNIVGNKIDWLKSAIATLPNALKHSPQKTRLQLAQLFRMLYDNIDLAEVNTVLENVIDELPVWTLLLWIPQIMTIAFNTKHPTPHAFTRILYRLGVSFPQPMFYAYRQSKFIDQKLVREEYAEKRKENYYLYSKLETLVNLLTNLPPSTPQGRIPITHLGLFSRCFSSLYVPMFDLANYRSDTEANRSPCIVQISENIQTDVRNNKAVSLITMLGSDSRQYHFRIEKRQNSIQSIFSSQCIDFLNSHLELTRESFIRKLRLNEVKKVFISQEVCLVATSPYTISLLDILNEHMSKTPFGEDYPDNDKSYMKIPKTEVNRTINHRMKDIVPADLLQQYFMGKSNTLDDYYLFRKQFGLSYAPTQLLQYIFGNESVLSDFIVALNTASISLDNFRVRTEATRISPFSVRLSRNIQHFLTDTTIMGGVLPAMVAATYSLLNDRLYFREYLSILMMDLMRSSKESDKQPAEKMQAEKQALEFAESTYKRVADLVDWSDEKHDEKLAIPDTLRVIVQTARRIGEMENIPVNLKYWF